jgi:uncharacterized protein YbjT (DUF2867 family)
VGRALVSKLTADGEAVRAMARSPDRARDLERSGAEVVRGDVLEPETLEKALEGARVAYYLVHSMGRGGDSGFAERDRDGARNFARAAASTGIEQIVYLGGLSEGGSEHLKSRHETAGYLGETGVPVTYLRAAAVIGSGSESFLTVYYLVKRLPVMVTPRWTNTKTQPIAIADVVSYLAAAPQLAEKDRTIEIGGPDITTYGGMMDSMADAIGVRRRPRIGVPALTPYLSSLWVGLVTPVDPGVAQPLIQGLGVETVVRDEEGMREFCVERTPLDEALRTALAELSHR